MKNTVLQNIVFPSMENSDTLPLYVDQSGIQKSSDNSFLYQRETTLKEDIKRGEELSQGNEATYSDDSLASKASRYSITIDSNKRISFATYFNAFPASYWKRWTTVKSVNLEYQVNGSGTIFIYKSNAWGNVQTVKSISFNGLSSSAVELPLVAFGDGGWYWFDIVSSDKPIVIDYARWTTNNVRPKIGEVTLQITTMNKPDYCISNLRAIGESQEVLDVVKEVLVVDQGTNKVQNHEDFEEVAELLAGKLRIINQANLGGSGGFARGMYEGVHNGSDYVLLLDDDVAIEPESIVRSIIFGDYCKKPTLVGGHMFDLNNRTVLHTFGEKINPYRFFWEPAHESLVSGFNFAFGNLRGTPWLHRRIDVDYNAWWMCLIPTAVIKEIGLSLPVFIKWDDAEYGYRAKKAGYNTVSLPGTAVWHVSWVDKDDLVGWQSYFHERNRLIAALIHSPYERGGRLLKESTFADFKHLISMQYSTEEGRIMAFKDVLAGPDHLHNILESRIKDVREMLSRHSETQFISDIDELPQPQTTKPPRKGRGFTPPSYKSLIPWTLKTLVRQTIIPVADEAKLAPQVHIAHQDNRWWRTSQYDSALVSNAEGSAVSWYKRNPVLLRSKLIEAINLHAQLASQWTQLSKLYREKAAEIASIESWQKTFDEHTESELTR
ncbi:glycosyltransferase [Rothia nasimurium]|uniref:glycosyltransferase n=1 Tax=Rothia nasimurium TaxID=85336 RepID=UPI001F270BC7|nr:glycosyltransferase [Rothia nasimurium]